MFVLAFCRFVPFLLFRFLPFSFRGPADIFPVLLLCVCFLFLSCSLSPLHLFPHFPCCAFHVSSPPSSLHLLLSISAFIFLLPSLPVFLFSFSVPSLSIDCYCFVFHGFIVFVLSFLVSVPCSSFLSFFPSFLSFFLSFFLPSFLPSCCMSTRSTCFEQSESQRFNLKKRRHKDSYRPKEPNSL